MSHSRRSSLVFALGLLFVPTMARPQTAPPATPPATSPAAPPASEIRVVLSEPIHAAVLPMKGSYAQHQDAFVKLGTWLGDRGAPPAGPPFGRYFSDPSAGEANLVWEVGFAVPAGIAAQAPFEIKDIPGGSTAVTVHRGPYEESGAAWPALIQWVIANGYQISGPPMQIFQGDPASDPRTELRLPVTKAP